MTKKKEWRWLLCVIVVVSPARAQETETLTTTGEHRFYVLNTCDGSDDAGRWVKAENLEEGNCFLLSDGGRARLKAKDQASTMPTKTEREDTNHLTIHSKHRFKRSPGTSHTTYNFEVSGYHTYFVGDIGTWVHNSSTRGCDPSLLFDPYAPDELIQPGGTPTAGFLRLEDSLGSKSGIYVTKQYIRKLADNREEILSHINPPTHQQHVATSFLSPTWRNFFIQNHRPESIGFTPAMKLMNSSAEKAELHRYLYGDLMPSPAFLVSHDTILTPQLLSSYACSNFLEARAHSIWVELKPNAQWIYASTHPAFDIQNYHTAILRDATYGFVEQGNLERLLSSYRHQGAILIPQRISQSDLSKLHIFANSAWQRRHYAIDLR